MPAAIRVGPDRIDIEEYVHGEPNPVRGLRNFVEKGDARLAEEMPRSVRMTCVGLPQVARAEVIIHFLAANRHHLAAFLLLLFGEQVIDKGVGPGEVVVVGHACFVVVSVPGAPFRVPLGGFEKKAFGELTVFLLPSKKTGEGERRGAVQDADGVGSISPPDVAPRVASPNHSLWVLWRFIARRWIPQQPLALTHQSVKGILLFSASKRAQPRQLFRAQEKPGMLLGNSSEHFLSPRHWERDSLT